MQMNSLEQGKPPQIGEYLVRFKIEHIIFFRVAFWGHLEGTPEPGFYDSPQNISGHSLSGATHWGHLPTVAD